jgi:hypothetical protein
VCIVTEVENFDGYPSKEIAGIFTELESAQVFIDSFDHYEGRTIRIEEYILNPFLTELRYGYNCYFLRMKKDGECFEVGLADSPPNTCLDYDPNWFPKFGFDVNGDLFCHTYARDEQHAVKICNKERLQLIAQNKWPQDYKPIETVYSWPEMAVQLGITEKELKDFAVEKGLIDKNGNPTQFAISEGLLI